MSIMWLTDQLAETVSRRSQTCFGKHIDAQDVQASDLPVFVTQLVIRCFIEQWPEDVDTRVLRHALCIMHQSGVPWISPNEPAIAAT